MAGPKGVRLCLEEEKVDVERGMAPLDLLCFCLLGSVVLFEAYLVAMEIVSSKGNESFWVKIESSIQACDSPTRKGRKRFL